MKKIYLALVATLVAAIIPVQVIANAPQLTAKNADGEVKVEITDKIMTMSAENILPGIKTSTEPTTNEITLKAEAGAIASFRFELPEAPGGKTNVLNNFIVQISDLNDVIVYDTDSANVAKGNDIYKEALIGEIKPGEEKTYKVTYQVLDPLVDVSQVSVKLAAKTNVVSTPAPQAPQSTLKPKFDMNSLENETEFVFDLEEEKKEKENENSEEKVTQIKKVCGVDIPAGRFVVTGNGHLLVTSVTGVVVRDVIIAEKPETGKSLDTAAVLLEKGDTIIITPLDGEEKARLKFSKAETEEATSTPTPAEPTEEPQKANPKTGDGSMGVLIGVAVFAVLAFAALELMKRRGNTKN